MDTKSGGGGFLRFILFADADESGAAIPDMFSRFNINIYEFSSNFYHFLKKKFKNKLAVVLLNSEARSVTTVAQLVLSYPVVLLNYEGNSSVPRG